MSDVKDTKTELNNEHLDAILKVVSAGINLYDKDLNIGGLNLNDAIDSLSYVLDAHKQEEQPEPSFLDLLKDL